MSRTMLVAAAAGVAWGVIAVLVYMAMRAGVLPSPTERTDPLGVGIIVLYAPFIAAVGLETLALRASPGVGEVVLLTIIVGGLGGIALASAGARLARPIRWRVSVRGRSPRT